MQTGRNVKRFSHDSTQAVQQLLVRFDPVQGVMVQFGQVRLVSMDTFSSQSVSVQEVIQCFGDFLFLDEVALTWIRKPSASVRCCCSSLPIILPWWSAVARHALRRTKKPQAGLSGSSLPSLSAPRAASGSQMAGSSCGLSGSLPGTSLWCWLS